MKKVAAAKYFRLPLRNDVGPNALREFGPKVGWCLPDHVAEVLNVKMHKMQLILSATHA
jgi:hypothetical protein